MTAALAPACDAGAAWCDHLTQQRQQNGLQTMTGAELKAIRKQLGLSVRQMGLAFGYQGNDNTLGVQIRQYETYNPKQNKGRPIPPWIERLALMYSRHGVPAHWTERT